VENNESVVADIQAPPDHLVKKVSLIRHFKKYMSKKLLMVCGANHK
jgi:hypothetical protein